jgi:alkanesulfonate monooxygenase SsuD/methylene tetrahydromethanopterin reductase-like flavin-dependent oxidoreductase (luciferase family)
MLIGVSLSSTHDVADHRVGARNMIERAGAAYTAGLDHLSIGDHHARRVPYYQNTPMLGRLLAEWKDRPAGCLFLTPLWHPVLMAEQIGTLAALHEGRFIVQTGLGSGRTQFGAMGRRLTARAGDFEECVRVVKALLEGEAVSSERFGISGASISPLPPEPVEWWIGAGADVALERAAHLSGTWYAGPGYTLAVARERLGRYLESLSVAGRTAERLVIRQDVVVAESDAAAQAIADPIVSAGYRGMDPDALAIGSVDTVTERFAAFAELGFTDVAARQISADQSVALESISLLGEIRLRLHP